MNLCQVTSPDDSWHDGPYSLWIKKGLGSRSRYWLEGELARTLGKDRKTVARAINRWTSKEKGGSEPTGEYLEALIALFGTPPPATEAESYREQGERIAALEEGQGKLMRLAVAEGKDRRALIAEVRELLRQTGDSR